MKINGKKSTLIPAIKTDLEKIYNWLCKSDLTPSMIGPPKYPENPIPTYIDFSNEYPLSFFCELGEGSGRVYIINVNNIEVGTISYDLLDKDKNRVVLDIWMRSENYCGHGYGSDAIITLSNYINEHYKINNFLILPSARNKRAIAAYSKAGFKYIKIMDKKEQEKEFGLSEYDDNVLMLKKL